MKHSTIFMLTVILLLNGCFLNREDDRVKSFDVPGMKSDACAQLIVKKLRSIQEVRSVDTDISNGVVTVDYNRVKVADKNIERAITELGFDCNLAIGLPSARKKLPAECR